MSDILYNPILSLIYEGCPFTDKSSPDYTLDNEKYIDPFPMEKSVEIACNNYYQEKV